MAHQYMPKIFHDPPQKSSDPPSYILNVRSLMQKPDFFRLIVSKKHLIEVAICRCSSKQVILEFPQYSQEYPVLESLFYKIALKFLVKKIFQHRYFPMKIVTFLGTAFCYSTPVAAFELNLLYSYYLP